MTLHYPPRHITSFLSSSHIDHVLDYLYGQLCRRQDNAVGKEKKIESHIEQAHSDLKCTVESLTECWEWASEGSKSGTPIEKICLSNAWEAEITQSLVVPIPGSKT